MLKLVFTTFWVDVRQGKDCVENKCASLLVSLGKALRIPLS